MGRKTKKTSPEVLQPEVERQLPVKPVMMPALDELNQIMERMLMAERRRARREFMALTIGLLCAFAVVLGAVTWFTRDLMFQLKEERRLSEKSREDLLGLIYSGHVTPPKPSIETPAPATKTTIPHSTPFTPTVSPEPQDQPTTTPATPITQPTAWRPSLDIQLADDMTMRLPIPPPP